MKNRHLALASALAILGAVTLTPKAEAQNSTTVNFNGTVNSTCTFSNVQNGTLVQPTPTAEYLMAESLLNNIGTSGSLEVNCTAPSSLSISAPVKIQAPAGFNPDVVQASLDGGFFFAANGTGQFSNSFPWNVSSSTIPVFGNNSTYYVGMVVGRNANTNGLPSGTYEYQVTVTATPD